MRKEERGTIMGTSLRSSLGFSGFGFLWVRFLVFRVSLGLAQGIVSLGFLCAWLEASLLSGFLWASLRASLL